MQPETFPPESDESNAAWSGERPVDNLVGLQGVGTADPASVPAPEVAGGIGGTNDGTQVSHHVSTAVPGKPMAPIASDPAGSSTDEGQALDPPAAGPHAERGGG